MRKKLLRQSLILISMTLALTVALVGLVTFTQLQKQYYDALKRELYFVQRELDSQGESALPDINTADRITLMSADGAIIFDSQVTGVDRDNQADRPEVEEAKEKGDSFSRRESEKLLTKNFYYAKRLADGKILRLSTSQDSFLGSYRKLIIPVVSICFLTALLAYLLNRRVVKEIVRPINSINLEQPEKSQLYVELHPLVQRLMEQNEKISSQMNSISQKDRQLRLITSHMEKGLILLDQDNRLLMANPEAARIFQIKDEDTMQPFDHLAFGRTLLEKADDLRRFESQEVRMELADRTYDAFITPVFQNEEFLGAVIFMFDVTQIISQEAMRREFTANVTHELKTPLTSISGYAEIIHAGIVQPQDVSRFAGKIHDEAQRLLNLVNDTLKLSYMENGLQLNREKVDWENILRQIKGSLQLTIEAKHQQLSIQTEQLTYVGYPSVIQDILYNLLENANKYSGDGSNISLTISQRAKGIEINVTDDGVGIPLQEQERIFERFYRRDKSHSPQVSGTGLGLAIVKHGVLLHHGRIGVQSKEAGGVSFIIYLPNFETEADNFSVLSETWMLGQSLHF